jgi:tRNA nucleotidyltransferase (CCA-adding enzyme)
MALVTQVDPQQLVAAFDAFGAAQPLKQRLADGNLDVYLVGGAVRDLMLEIPPRELDLLVESELEPVLERLGAAGTRHDRFATAQLELDGFRYDLARTRREVYERPGALPTVSPAGLEEDLTRRDFTVNAIALAVLGPSRGRLVSLPASIPDLEAKTLRVLHDRSFIDDPTRLMRLAMYAGRLGFAIDERTELLARAATAGGALDTVSGNRLGAELRQIASEPDALAPLATLNELAIDQALTPGFGVADPGRARAALALLPPDGDPGDLAIAAAGVDVAPDSLAQLLERLAFEAAPRKRILAAAANARPMAAALARADRPSEIAAAVDHAGSETVALAGAYGGTGAAQRWLSDLRHVKLEIGGADLLAAGIPSGPSIGRGLRAALAAKLDGQAATRQDELEQALAAACAQPISLDAHGDDDRTA